MLSRRAAELVSRHGNSITQIAFDLGYSDPAHFTRAFIRWFGESPQSLRRSKSNRAAQSSPFEPQSIRARR
ncbi:MAG: helix-turn-helix domain-containing protein [Steroidobacteraceae bacterium]